MSTRKIFAVTLVLMLLAGITSASLASSTSATGSYTVYALPSIGPNDDAPRNVRTVEGGPDLADPVASPYGWHDTDGISSTAEYTVTRGNNVSVQLCNDGFQPDGGPTLVFDPALPGLQLDDTITASLVNAFYWGNVLHDVFYNYGFDEESGNFQQNNYGRGGSAGDAVQIRVLCNSSQFEAALDGSPPTLNLGVSNDKNVALDSMGIIHEYGHGVSSRLMDKDSIWCQEANELKDGEGWGDWWALVLTSVVTDTREITRGLATYVAETVQDRTGQGLRDYPYSTDMNVNPLTYGSIKDKGDKYTVGTLWATMLWEMYWNLVDAYGFDPDFYTGSGGNNIALQLVIDGLKGHGDDKLCNPGFVDARDAILAADVERYGGANQCLIWNAFAKRGLGVSAQQGDPYSTTDGVEAFDVPPACGSPSVVEMIGQVKSDTLFDYVGGLSGEHPVSIGGSDYTIATRHTDSITPVQKATQYVYEHFQDLGLDVSYQNWTASTHSGRNVIGVMQGLTRPDEIVLVTAHLDSLPDSGSAPGADDNASGSAAVLVAADILSKYTFERTIRFVLFTGEEQGKLGSAAYAHAVHDDGDNIVAVYNMDMIGWDAIGGPVAVLHTRAPGDPGQTDDMAIANTFVDVVNDYHDYGLGVTPVISPSGLSRSDHASFWNEGYPAVLAVEDFPTDYTDRYHKVTDTLASLNMTYYTSFARASIGTSAELAMLYKKSFLVSPEPTTVKVCAPNDAVYDVDVLSISGPSDPVTLTTQGQPGGTTTTFSVNPVAPGNASLLTIGNTGSATAGAYDIDIIGTAASDTSSATVALEMFDVVPATVTLVSPPAGASKQPLAPTYEWTGVVQGDSYELEVATNAAFTNVVFARTVAETEYVTDGVFGRGHTNEGVLQPSTLYYWRVQAANACGVSAPSQVFTFTTGIRPHVLLVDDDDNTPDVRAYYTGALDTSGVLYDIWDTDYSNVEPDATMLANYKAVIWFSGDSYRAYQQAPFGAAGPGADGEAALASFLSAGSGKRLFISSAAYPWDRIGGSYMGTGTGFLKDYLGVANYTAGLLQSYTVISGTGVFGQVGPYTLTYPASFYLYGGKAEPDGTAQSGFEGNPTYGAAVTKETTGTSGYKTTYWGFPFEALPAPDARQTAMSETFKWFIPLGDVNWDGEIDIIDALAVDNHLNGVHSGPFYAMVADVNCDGTIDDADATLIAEYYVGLITEFPCSAP